MISVSAARMNACPASSNLDANRNLLPAALNNSAASSNFAEPDENHPPVEEALFSADLSNSSGDEDILKYWNDGGSQYNSEL